MVFNKKPQIIKLKSLLREAPDSKEPKKEKDDSEVKPNVPSDKPIKSEKPKDPNASEPSESDAAEQAHKLKLVSKGWGRWADNTGKVVAKTIDGKLVKLDKPDEDEYDEFGNNLTALDKDMKDSDEEERRSAELETPPPDDYVIQPGDPKFNPQTGEFEPEPEGDEPSHFEKGDEMLGKVDHALGKIGMAMSRLHPERQRDIETAARETADTGHMSPLANALNHAGVPKLKAWQTAARAVNGDNEIALPNAIHPDGYGVQVSRVENGKARYTDPDGNQGWIPEKDLRTDSGPFQQSSKLGTIAKQVAPPKKKPFQFQEKSIEDRSANDDFALTSAKDAAKALENQGQYGDHDFEEDMQKSLDDLVAYSEFRPMNSESFELLDSAVENWKEYQGARNDGQERRRAQQDLIKSLHALHLLWEKENEEWEPEQPDWEAERDFHRGY